MKIAILIYIYNNDTYKLYKELNFNSINIYPYQIDDDKILKGYSKDKMDINGMELEILTDNKGYPIVYGMNLNTGEISSILMMLKKTHFKDIIMKFQKNWKKKINCIYFNSVRFICIIELLIMIIILAQK